MANAREVIEGLKILEMIYSNKEFGIGRNEQVDKYYLTYGPICLTEVEGAKNFDVSLPLFRNEYKWYYAEHIKAYVKYI